MKTYSILEDMDCDLLALQIWLWRWLGIFCFLSYDTFINWNSKTLKAVMQSHKFLRFTLNTWFPIPLKGFLGLHAWYYNTSILCLAKCTEIKLKTIIWSIHLHTWVWSVALSTNLLCITYWLCSAAYLCDCITVLCWEVQTGSSLP